MHSSSKFFRIKIMKEFFKSNKKEILGVTAIIVISIISTAQNDEYCTENIWVDDEKHYDETNSSIEGNYCVDVEDSLMYPFKAELEARFEDTVNAETIEYLDGFISSVDYKGCKNLVYLYVHTQIVYENFKEDLEAQYHLDVRKFYKHTTGVDENFDYFELERIGLEKDCFK